MKEYKNGSVKFDLTELNLLSIFAHEAADHYKAFNCPALEKDARETANLLYAICDKHGMYKDC